MNTTNYKLEKGDTVRVTGCHGQIFGACSPRELADGVELGVECVLTRDQDSDYEVGLPEGILANGNMFIHMGCVELVKKRDRKPATVKDDLSRRVFMVSDGEDEHYLAKIWYENIPKDIAECLAKQVKAAYDVNK